MQRKKWILDVYGPYTANSVYLMFSLFRMKVVREACPRDFMKGARESLFHETP